jgi:hypothetical protein
MPSARVHARVLETPRGFFDRLDLFIASARGSTNAARTREEWT